VTPRFTTGSKFNSEG